MTSISNIIKLTLVFILLALISACGGGSTESSSSSSNVRLVGAVGDSIGTGFGGVSPWPDLVRQQTGLDVINFSREGRNAAFSVGTVRAIIENDRPSHLLILLGTNDSNRGSVSAAISAMQQIVELAFANDVVPIIGTVPPRNSRSREISAGYRTLGAPIAEIEGAFGSGAGLFQADGIHPNNAGEAIIANEFSNLLQ